MTPRESVLTECERLLKDWDAWTDNGRNEPTEGHIRAALTHWHPRGQNLLAAAPHLVRDLLSLLQRSPEEPETIAQAFRDGWATGYQERAEGLELDWSQESGERPAAETAALERWLFVQAASAPRSPAQDPPPTTEAPLVKGRPTADPNTHGWPEGKL